MAIQDLTSKLYDYLFDYGKTINKFNKDEKLVVFRHSFKFKVVNCRLETQYFNKNFIIYDLDLFYEIEDNTIIGVTNKYIGLVCQNFYNFEETNTKDQIEKYSSNFMYDFKTKYPLTELKYGIGNFLSHLYFKYNNQFPENMYLAIELGVIHEPEILFKRINNSDELENYKKRYLMYSFENIYVTNDTFIGFEFNQIIYDKIFDDFYNYNKTEIDSFNKFCDSLNN